MGKHEKTNEVKNNKKLKKKKKHIVLKIFIVLIILLGVFIGKRIYDLEGNWLALIMGHNKDTLKNLDKLEFLILGESTGMSDTIIVCSYDPKAQEASMLSIPRDTFVGDSIYYAGGSDKINSLYSQGEGKTPMATVEAVNKITGLNIEKYILVDTEALIKLVDTIGGLEFEVPINMDYDDYSQNLHIKLNAGYQKLTGAQTEQLVRFRHNNDGSTYPEDYCGEGYGGEDYGRMKTQRTVIITLAKQTIKWKNVAEIGSIIDIIKEYVDTNMNLDELKDYVPYAINMNMENIQTARLPGSDDNTKNKYGIWFFYYDEEKTAEVVNQLFGDKSQIEEGSSDNTNEVEI